MYPNKTLTYFILIVLALSGLSGFLIEEVFLGINKSFLSFILDLSLLVVAGFSIHNTRPVRKLISFFLIFLTITLGSFALNFNELSFVIYFNGLREFLPYFLFPIIYINLLNSSRREFYIRKFNSFLYIFLSLQIPVSLYQLSKYGAGDMVGGTLGAGGSGILTFLVFLATYYLMVQDFDANHVYRSFKKKSYLLLFWLPAFINETKISFVLIILFVLLLVKISITNIRKYIFLALTIIPLLFIFDSIYKSTTNHSITAEYIDRDFLTKYFIQDDENETDIPRIQRIAIYLTTFNVKEILLGKGIGQFKGGTTLDPTPFARDYEWLLQGSRTMFFFLLVQVGLIGAISFIFFWFYLISFRPHKQKRINYSGNLLAFATGCFIIIQFYNDSLRSLFFSGILLFIMTYAISKKKETKIIN